MHLLTLLGWHLCAAIAPHHETRHTESHHWPHWYEIHISSSSRPSAQQPSHAESGFRQFLHRFHSCLWRLPEFSFFFWNTLARASCLTCPIIWKQSCQAGLARPGQAGDNHVWSSVWNLMTGILSIFTRNSSSRSGKLVVGARKKRMMPQKNRLNPHFNSWQSKY